MIQILLPARIDPRPVAMDSLTSCPARGNLVKLVELNFLEFLLLLFPLKTNLT